MALSRQIISHSQVCKAHCDQRTQLEAGGGDLCSALSQYCITSYDLQVFLTEALAFACMEFELEWVRCV